MPAFFRELTKLTHILCCWHLEKNVRSSPSVSDKSFHKNQFWAIQDAETEEAYNVNMKKLAHSSPSAAAYLSKIPKEHWVSYAIFEKYGIHSHGYTTNGQVEQANGKFVEARKRSPIEMAQEVLLMTNVDLQITREFIAATRDKPTPLLTPHGDALFLSQVNAPP